MNWIQLNESKRRFYVFKELIALTELCKVNSEYYSEIVHRWPEEKIRDISNLLGIEIGWQEEPYDTNLNKFVFELDTCEKLEALSKPALASLTDFVKANTAYSFYELEKLITEIKV